jgi:hypothetical protein
MGKSINKVNKIEKMKFGAAIKDWRFKKNYPDPKKTNRFKWAWEFLRRDPEYQDDYGRYLKTNSNQTKKRLKKKWGLKYKMLNPKGKAYKGEYHFFTYPKEFFLQNPDEATEELILNPFSHILEWGFIFNLHLPIKKQIQIAENELLKIKKKIKLPETKVKERFPYENYQLYLRLLDAKGKNEKTKQIIEKLYKGQAGDLKDKIKKNIQAALKHRNNYKLFLLPFTCSL